jgi:UDP-3-O-acyl-N-acetylglucosamine deacetylase
MHSATITRSVRIRGRGIFSGEPCAVTVHPAAAGSGLVFIKDGKLIPAHPDNFIEGPQTSNTTGFGAGSAQVLMTEHLLAALWCAGIDTAVLECDGPELPNQDGSALPYFEQLRDCELQQFAERPPLQVAAERLAPVEEYSAQDGDTERGSRSPSASLAFLPGRPGSLTINYTFAHPELGQQIYRGSLERRAVAREILPARTFITESEARHLQAAGILHHSDDRVALLLRGGLPNQRLHFLDEYARHKVLDLVGDLSILPYELHGQFTAFRSGHRLNRALARQLLNCTC